MMYLLNTWDVDMASFVETQADWRHVNTGRHFINLFACGRDRHIVTEYTFTVKRILNLKGQRCGTIMMTFGRAVTSGCMVDRDETSWAGSAGPN